MTQKVKAHVKFYVREAIATVILDHTGEVVEIQDVEELQDFEDIEVKEIIY